MTWGHQGSGGDSSGVQAVLKTGVDTIYSTGGAFCAKLLNGGIVTWGDEGSGGDSSGVQAELKTGVDTIYSTGGAFCATLVNGHFTLICPNVHGHFTYIYPNVHLCALQLRVKCPRLDI